MVENSAGNFAIPPEIPGYTGIGNCPIGKGGESEVWLYETADTLKTKVAIKIISVDDSNPEEHINRINRELDILTKFQHDNLIQYHGFRILSNLKKIAIITEYIPGSLKDLINKSSEKFPIETVIKIMTGLLNGVSYLHNENIIHRDIKPANIMVKSKKSTIYKTQISCHDIKIIDFGISKNLNLYDDSTYYTSKKIPIGTPAYGSPEFHECLPKGSYSDVYSIGLILYELLIGKPDLPHLGQEKRYFGQHQSVWKHIPEHSLANVPPPLIHILKKALEYAPQKRYPNAGDMLTDFMNCDFKRKFTGWIPRGWLDKTTVTVKEDETEGPSPTTKYIRKLLFGVLAAAMILFGGYYCYQWYKNLPPKPVQETRFATRITIEIAGESGSMPVSDQLGGHYKSNRSYSGGTEFRLLMNNTHPANMYAFATDDKSRSATRLFPPDGISPSIDHSGKTITGFGKYEWIQLDNVAGTDYLVVLFSKGEIDIDTIEQKFANEKGTFNQRVANAVGNNFIPYSGKILKDFSLEFSKSSPNPEAIVGFLLAIDHK